MWYCSCGINILNLSPITGISKPSKAIKVKPFHNHNLSEKGPECGMYRTNSTIAVI